MLILDTDRFDDGWVHELAAFLITGAARVSQ